MLIIGHRGSGGDVPENTLKSFAAAIKDGANAVELDVRKTKDNKLVVFHNEKVDKLTKVKGYVNNFTLEELKKLDIMGEKIPTLEEALDFIDSKVSNILIEIKEVGTEEKILDIVKKKKLESIVILISFHEEALMNIRKKDKQIQTGFIYASYKDPIGTADKVGASYLLPLYRFTHSKDIERAHDHNLKIIVWTVNTKEEMQAFKSKGVDGIATDYPGILAKQ